MRNLYAVAYMTEDEPGDTITIEIPEWLAEDRGLI